MRGRGRRENRECEMGYVYRYDKSANGSSAYISVSVLLFGLKRVWLEAFETICI